MTLKAIFYARFHPERGPSIIHQYPVRSIIVPKSSAGEALLNFSNISPYVIPPYELCNRFMSITSDDHQILGFPVSLEDAKYARNRFTFNVCFVLSEQIDPRPFEQIVRKTAYFFKALEGEDGLLSSSSL